VKKASSLALFVVAGVVGSADAQTLQPQFYMWGAPSHGVSPPVLWTDRQFMPIILLQLGSNNSMLSPQDVALAAQARIQEFADNNWLDPTKVCITFDHFGAWREDPQVAMAHSFFHEEDYLRPPPDLVQTTPPAPLWMDYAQPWMSTGIAEAKLWMIQFLDSYNALDYIPHGASTPVSLPIPARFHFDTEVHIVVPEAVNQIRLMEAIALDSRWATEPVPGQGNSTMQDLYADAALRYGWWAGPPAVLTPFDQAIRRNENTDSDINRPYYLWFSRVCQAALDAAMKEAAYDVIKDSQSWPPNSEPLPKVSNYDDANEDGMPSEFGWYPRANPAGPQPQTFVPSRHAPNGRPHGGYTGIQHFLNDLQGPGGEYSLWLVMSRTASGDFSAPECYAPWYVHTQHSPMYYLPAWPIEKRGDSALRMNRQSIESILNSGIHGPDQIAPWVLMEHANAVPGNPTTLFHAEDVRRHLAMFRAKNLGELLVWWWHPEHQNAVPVSWESYRKKVRQVYSPRLVDYSLDEGTIALPATVSALQYTLADPGNDRLIVATSSFAIASIITKFENLIPDPQNPLGSTLRLNLELDVLASAATIADVRVKAFIWHDDLKNWHPLESTHWPYGSELSFSAPQHQGWYELRRQLEVGSEFVADESFLKVVVYSQVGDHFVTRFDLVQVYWDDESITSIMMSTSEPQGADMNYDGVVCLKDFEKFTDDYANGRPPADFNFDGVIDAADLAGFISAFHP
jgi:hypothetical protein